MWVPIVYKYKKPIKLEKDGLFSKNIEEYIEEPYPQHGRKSSGGICGRLSDRNFKRNFLTIGWF